MDSYTGSFGASQAGISLYRLKQTLQKAAADAQDPQEAVQAELDSWQESRPSEIAGEQSTRANNAVAKFVYTLVGIKLLRWVTFGDSCPYCNKLNGRVVEITKTFLEPGQCIWSTAKRR